MEMWENAYGEYKMVVDRSELPLVLISHKEKRVKLLASREGEKFKLFDYVLIVQNGIPVLRKFKDKMMEVFDIIGGPSEVTITFDEIEYKFHWDAPVSMITVTNNGIFVNRNVTKLPKEVIEFIVRGADVPQERIDDPFMDYPSKIHYTPFFDWRKTTIKATNSYKEAGEFVPMKSIYDTFEWEVKTLIEAKLSLPKVQIKTKKGTKSMQLKPFTFYWLDVEKLFIEAPQKFYDGEALVKNFPVRINNRVINYVAPGHWYMLKDGKRIVSFMGRIYRETECPDIFIDCRGAFESRNEKLITLAELPGGQRVPLVRIFNGRARLYMIATGEGVFVLDVPIERLSEPRKISALEDNVTIVGTFIVYPIQVAYTMSSVTINGSDVSIEYDGKVFDVPKIENWKTAFDEVFGVKKEDYDVIMNYGFL